MPPRLRRAALASVALGFGAATIPLAAAPASAQTVVQPAPATTSYQVTMVARECDRYTDIFANRARNDIMESLRDLGPDSPYGSGFTAIQPSVEDGQAPQTACRPLPNWTFSFGTGIARPVPGTNLSYVTGTGAVNNRQATTLPSVPLLDTLGKPTGQSIAGAVTFTMTDAEAQIASRNSRYWAMGGTTTQPLNGQGQDYGFGALRCAKDNLNGDNVEWIGFPSGQNHVFCYAFYVKPPPTGGRIIIRKQIDSPSNSSVPVDFTGNLSYNANGNFTITVPPGQGGQLASTEFIRGATGPTDEPWTVTELVPDGLGLRDIDCQSRDDTSSWTFSGTNANATSGLDTVAITLAGQDTVTCTFTNAAQPPPPGQGRVLKLLVGPDTGVPTGVLPATWDFPYTGPNGLTGTLSLPAVPANPSADSGLITDLPPGEWTIGEQLPPATPGWRWEFESGSCAVSNGEGTTTVPIQVDPGTGRPTASLVVPPAGGASCLFLNRLVPTGGLIIRLTTKGGTGTFGFVVAGAEQSSTAPPAPPDVTAVEQVGGASLRAGQQIGGNGGITLVQSATTAAPDSRVVATGQSTNPLVGIWDITPIRPVDTPAGRWVIDGLPACNVTGAPALNLGPEILRVVPGNSVAPVLTCDYVYRLVPPSTLDLEKVIAGDPAGQGSPVVITASCSDGSSARLEVAPGTPTPARLPATLPFLYPVTCQVAETTAGAAPGASVQTVSQVRVNGAPANRPLGALTVGTADSAEAVVAQFTNTYTVPPPDTSAAPPSTLPPTGAGGGTTPTVLLALAALALGAVALVVSRLRRT